jgi:hypothetical protein
MDSKSKRKISATALFVAFAVSQVYLTTGFAGSLTAEPGVVALPQQPSAILTTAGNKPISVNGANAVSGATIISGALVETPNQVGATIDIPGQSRLEISPNARLILTFAGGSTKVTLLKGCVTLHANRGVTGEIVTGSGKELGKTDPAKDGDLKICEPIPGGGVSPAVIGLIGAGAAVGAIVAIAGGGDTTSSNPSPSGP